MTTVISRRSILAAAGRFHRRGRAAGSVSWAGLLNGHFWIDPATLATGALFTQVLPFFGDHVTALYSAFEPVVHAGIARA